MRKNFEVIKGDTLAFGVELEFTEKAQDLEKAYFTVKTNPDDLAIFQKSLGNGIEKAGRIGNKIYYRVRADPKDTVKLEAGMYYYDLEIRVNGDIFTILNGFLIVGNEITEF